MRHIGQMTIPGKGHKHVTATEQNQSDNIGIHLLHTPHPFISSEQKQLTGILNDQNLCLWDGLTVRQVSEHAKNFTTDAP
jgi:hypothetical protein